MMIRFIILFAVFFISSCDYPSKDYGVSKETEKNRIKVTLAGFKDAKSRSKNKLFIYDGDTFDVFMPDSTKASVRFLGIDTPEADPQKGMSEYGLLSKNFLESFIKVSLGRTVGDPIDLVLWYDGPIRKDPYDRILAEPQADGKSPVIEALKLGYAVSCFFPESMSRVKELVSLQKEARKNGFNIWALEANRETESKEMLDKILKNCDGILGASNFNIYGIQNKNNYFIKRLSNLPGLEYKGAEAVLQNKKADLKNYSELLELIKKHGNVSAANLSQIENILKDGLFVYEPAQKGLLP